MNREEMKKNSIDERMYRLYDLSQMAAHLTKEQPFFKMHSGIYAIEERKNDKGETIPTNFRRMDKNRLYSGKQRRAVRQAQQKEVKRGEEFKRIAAGQ
jgi:hypothetical protein